MLVTDLGMMIAWALSKCSLVIPRYSVVGLHHKHDYLNKAAIQNPPNPSPKQLVVQCANHWQEFLMHFWWLRTITSATSSVVVHFTLACQFFLLFGGVVAWGEAESGEGWLWKFLVWIHASDEGDQKPVCDHSHCVWQSVSKWEQAWEKILRTEKQK